MSRPLTEKLQAVRDMLDFDRAAAFDEVMSDNAKLRTKLEIARSAQTDLTSEVFSEKRKHEQSLAAGKFREDRITFLESQNKKLDEIADNNDQLRKALEPIEFCAEARGDHWCPSCRGNKQEGTPTRGHYAHCPIYFALKKI